MKTTIKELKKIIKEAASKDVADRVLQMIWPDGMDGDVAVRDWMSSVSPEQAEHDLALVKEHFPNAVLWWILHEELGNAPPALAGIVKRFAKKPPPGGVSNRLG